MEIEKIIYQTTREIIGVEDKMRIATIFLFCYKLDSKLFSELLYKENKEIFLYKLNTKYQEYEIDFNINLNDKNINSAFTKTIDKVIEKYDKHGFYKALFEKDDFALACVNITDSFDNIKLKETFKKIKGQLSISFK